ncbi:hypothetical protein ABID65_003271 [Bradyrhizobium sp. S3.9.2]|uniref:hypothetical protein n=1 Tax=Bradyrhizobium sp. S3.9.2 TaxID=3156432 RepID=UPI0033919DF3
MPQAAESYRTILSRLVNTHTHLTDPARGPLPNQIADTLGAAACEIQKEIVATPSASWSEFGAKACLLITELTTDPTTGWLDAIRESLRADVERLGAAA